MTLGVLPLFALCSCGSNGEAGDSEQFVTSLNNNNYSAYLGKSSSFIESGSAGAWYLVVTVRIYPLDDAYKFVNAKATCYYKTYSLPTDGNLTFTYNTIEYPSKDSSSWNLAKVFARDPSISFSGQIYKTK